MSLPPAFLREKYEEVASVDQGAYGTVYKCTRAEVTTAVKVLDVLDAEAQARFKAEIEILQCIDHLHVVKILDWGIADGTYWYESEYTNYGHFGKMAGYLFYSDVDRVQYFSQICSGVQALHELNPPIIHRDLKPSNILVYKKKIDDQYFLLKVADFGLVASASFANNLTATGRVLGTQDYLAPERRETPRIKTPQSDIYSLGVTFLEACTGRVRPTPENLSLVPQLLRPIIEKMVREMPRDRYQSVNEIIEELNSISITRLLYGRELQPGEIAGPIYNVNIGRDLENVFSFLLQADSGNVLDRLANLERALDRLGGAYDHRAHMLMNIHPNLAKLIEEADDDALYQLVQKFLTASEHTSDHDWHRPDIAGWARFLAETFQVSKYRATKSLCLEGLANLLARFGDISIKHYLYQVIVSIEDPSYMQDIAEYLRRIDRADIARLLDEVPETRDLDIEKLQIALKS